jgi:hypothetical protein
MCRLIFGEISFAGAGLVDELTVKHYDPTIRQFERFVEILADHRGEIEPETGIAGDRHLDFAAGFPRQYRRLYVAARQR